MYKHLLVTLDGSETSEAVLTEVPILASGQDVVVTLLTVAEPPGGTADAPERGQGAGTFSPGVVAERHEARVYEERGQAIDRVEDELTTYLAGKARALKDLGVHVDTLVAFGSPVDEIMRAADSLGADLIVTATHGRTGLASAVFGGVAQRVVATGRRPVLLVRPEKLR